MPFVSIPLGSLMGQYADWSTMLSVNWPSLLALGLTVLLAAVAVPWLVAKLGGDGGGLHSFLNLGNLGKMTGYGRADDGQSAGWEDGRVPDSDGIGTWVGTMRLTQLRRIKLLYCFEVAFRNSTMLSR